MFPFFSARKNFEKPLNQGSAAFPVDLVKMNVGLKVRSTFTISIFRQPSYLVAVSIVLKILQLLFNCLTF